jgi:hypothetical protein
MRKLSFQIRENNNPSSILLLLLQLLRCIVNLALKNSITEADRFWLSGQGSTINYYNTNAACVTTAEDNTSVNSDSNILT